mmetsp:Transcript_105502/g.305127  ORF Transcript_105502/g.305127 Transcript_105502/m.305127 type:complete len:126 (-) Transcript_105502:129-506(-)
MPLAPARASEQAPPTATCREIDSEDEAWDGKIEETIFQQVEEQQARWRLIERLEAQNRDGKPQGRGLGGALSDATDVAGEKAKAGAVAFEAAMQDAAGCSSSLNPGAGEQDRAQEKAPSAAAAPQ